MLRESLEDGVLRLVLDRPHRRNALDRALGTALLAALRRAAGDQAVRVVVLSGSGAAFCAGDDIATIEELLAGDSEQLAAEPLTGDALYLRIAQAMIACPKPVLVALNGDCAGAGTEIACAADLRIAKEGARIASALVRIGQVGNAALLPRVVGQARATEIYLSGRFVSSEEAERIGLVHEVVAADRFEARVAEVADALANQATRAIGLYKELRERTLATPVDHAMRLQDVFHRRCMDDVGDALEGARAFLEKRAPHFTGA